MSLIAPSGNHIYTEELGVRQSRDSQTIWETQIDNKEDKLPVASSYFRPETKAQRPGRLFLKPRGPLPVDHPDKFKAESGHVYPQCCGPINIPTFVQIDKEMLKTP